MTLEFERLTAEIANMAQVTAERLGQRAAARDVSQALLDRYATDWPAVRQALAEANEKADPKFYRSARPLNETEPLNAAIPAPEPPTRATIIAADGSQIRPDRHAAYLYYLINIGGLVYHHGSGQAPDQFSTPTLHYPQADGREDKFDDTGGTVSIERDLAEIGMLAEKAQEYRTAVPPILAILDQRLLYWPIGPAGVAENAAVTEWGDSMTRIRQADALLAGYIDRPATGYVTTLLRSLQALDEPDFDWKSLGQREASWGLTDGHLFSQLLGPGQRSKVYVTVSEPNHKFAAQHQANEVCFFYLNPGTHGRQVARVDIPMWVAADEGMVTAVHALVYDQCQILGDYPYVLARADETAVVTYRDQEQLNFMIDVIMERYGLSHTITAKQASKNIARGGKTRHKGL
ncbi:MAG TPA: DNA double-strand break repair nuclease NurA [Chloroflexota bacterium]|nr:DNA double-strand break repair nuclease NurA [Chloroflexota bacterium]